MAWTPRFSSTHQYSTVGPFEHWFFDSRNVGTIHAKDRIKTNTKPLSMDILCA